MKGKPDPAIYLLAAKHMAVRPQNIAVIEDSVSGVRAAKAAGMNCLGIAKVPDAICSGGRAQTTLFQILSD